jgi:tRNA threonylcarbamoyl adenosine modification protein YeaZ
MPRLLAIETSGSVCSAAVSIDGSLVSSSEILRSNVHDEMLAGLVSDVCLYADIALADIDIVAVSAGPGSFTGLRIGASFAKGLCFASTSVHLLAVPTHVALMAAGLEVAQLAGVPEIVCAIGSHRDLLYISQTSSSDLDVTASATLLTVAEGKESLNGRNALVVGPAAGALTTSPVSGLSRLSARFVAYAAWIMLSKGSSWSHPNTFVPDYHQEFQPR